MRKIVLKQEETQLIDSIMDRDNVGILWEGGTKSMVLETEQGYCAIDNQYNPCILSVWYEESTKKYVKRALAQGYNTNHQAFIFDTVAELYKWMSE